MKFYTSCLLSTAYLPPVEFFSAIKKQESVLIEANENYNKQSYRNRCNILAANGLLPLTIPIEKDERLKIPITDVKISYHAEWHKMHWKSIVSAYNCSPFFEFYQDYFYPFYEKKYNSLWEYNYEIIELCLKLLQLNNNIKFTEIYFATLSDNILDLRNKIHPKQNSDYKAIPYTQVFQTKHHFVGNLSIIDLLCNEGPFASTYL